MTAIGVALSLCGLMLTLAAAVYLVVSTRRLRATGTPDPGLRGSRGVALAALLVGLAVANGAVLIFSR